MNDAAHVEKTVLFADIAGSTRLYGEFGDKRTKDLLSVCLNLMAGIVSDRNGRVARRIGDELLCTFPTADEAALAAIELHTKVSGGHASGLFFHPMRVRIGFEHGPIIESDALFGNVVHTAARVASMAKAGQTLTTKGTLDRINPALRCFARYCDTAVLKGQGGEQEIHELLWSVPQATLQSRAERPGRTRTGADLGFVELDYGGRTFRVDAERPHLEVGRDPSCDVCVQGASVSHVHMRVLWDRGRVTLEDVSTNGTVIAAEEANRRLLRRERGSLRGSGVLFLGDDEDADLGASISFRCG